jgi:membrane-bound metal-dependent hydrolase YbcI (DUF457 family)
MRKRNHFSVTFAISLWIYLFYFNNNIIETLILSFFTASLSSLPDIDIQITEKLAKLEKYTFGITKPISVIAHLFFKHRTYTHTIYIPLVLYYLSEVTFSMSLMQVLLRPFYLAIFLHILEDITTMSGVKILYPLPFNPKLKLMTTSSLKHTYITEIIAWCATFFFAYNYIL